MWLLCTRKCLVHNNIPKVTMLKLLKQKMFNVDYNEFQTL